METGRTIGQLAKEAGVGVETVRFYQRKGLLPEPERPRQGYRRYGDEVLRDLVFVRRAQGLGFTLREIRELLSMFREGEATCGQVTELARRKRREVQQRIRALQEIEAALGRAEASCACLPEDCPCPVLERFPFENFDQEGGDSCCDP